MSNKNKDYILEMENITKTFLGGKIIANDDVTLRVERNEVHALVGENGSGKSTIMSILFGLYKQDAGTIKFNGEYVNMYSAGAAKKHKIGMVHQHFHLVDEFTILDNILLGQEQPTKDKELIVELKAKYSKEKEKLAKLMNDLTEEELSQYKSAKKNIWPKVQKVEKKLDKLIVKNDKLTKKLELTHDEKDIEKIKEQIKSNQNEQKELNKELKALVKEGNGTGKVLKVSKQDYKVVSLDKEIKGQKITKRSGVINRRNAIARFETISNKYNINLKPHDKVGDLPVGQKQMVEIMKTLWEEKDLIVFDEPTATLSVKEIEDLMGTIKALKDEGKTIIFISHKLAEVKDLATNVSVLRKGKYLGTFTNNKQLSPQKISKLMVGKDVKISYPKRNIKGDEILKVEGLNYYSPEGYHSVKDVSFTVKEGEIFGLAGIEGNGQEEVLNLIAGLLQQKEGTIELRDENIGEMPIAKRAEYYSHVPIDRTKHGIVNNASLKFNSMLTALDSPIFSKAYLQWGREEEDKKKIKELKIQLNELNATKKEMDKLQAPFNKKADKLAQDIAYYKEEEGMTEKDPKIRSLRSQLRSIDADAIKLLGVDFKKKEKILNKNIATTTEKLDKLINKYPGYNLVIDDSSADSWTRRIVEELNVDGAVSNNIEIRNLSGGNQQKFVVGREILKRHDLFLAGHPTRGLDVSAIDNIYKKMLANSKGKATILYSLEISELVAVCDRMAVMYNGKIIDIVDPKNTSMEKISNLMIGVK